MNRENLLDLMSKVAASIFGAIDQNLVHITRTKLNFVNSSCGYTAHVSMDSCSLTAFVLHESLSVTLIFTYSELEFRSVQFNSCHVNKAIDTYKLQAATSLRSVPA